MNTGERTLQVFTYNVGFRVGAGGRIYAARRILLLGDSFMEAFQVEYEQSVAGLLERRLPDLVGGSVSVRNTAVGGWDPNQYLLQARRSLARESYDLVVVGLYLGNDIVRRRIDRYPPRVPAEVHPFAIPRSLRYRELKGAFFYPINDFLEVRSQLFILFKKQARTLLMRLGLTAAYFPRHFRRDEAASDRWMLTAQVCRDIVDLAQQHGVQTVVVLLPTAYQIDTAVFHRYMRGFGIDTAAVDIKQPNRLLTAALKVYASPFIDVSSALASAHASGLKLYGAIDNHLAPAGHEVVARAIAPMLVAMIGEN